MIEKRFAPSFNYSSNKWPCVALSKEVHRIITNRFREEWGYGGRKHLTKSELKALVNRVYRDMPELRRIALKQIDEHISKKGRRP